MGVPVRALCVLTVGSAIAWVAPGQAEARESFDLLMASWSTPFAKKREPYVRTRPDGSIGFDWVWVWNRGPGRAPPTTVGFRWKERGAIVQTVRVSAIDARTSSRRSRPVRVPLPVRDGRYHLWLCANTPPVDTSERRRDDNCEKMPRLVIVRRTRPAPNPNGTVLLDIAPTSWDFGSVAPGTSAEAQNFTVRNLGTGYTGAGNVAITGAGSGAYEIGSNGCDPGLSGTSACRIRITFTPPAPGSYPAELVASFAKGEVRVPLSGSGG
jgi:hypothetical protein